MGLEVSTYLAGLTASWPINSDPKSQGDDHLRLIKGALQSTFPNASKPFYLPTSRVASGPLTLLTTDQNSFITLSTTGADVSVTLPTLAAGDAGWWCEIIKSSADGFGVMVAPASGTISSQVGATATVRVGVLFQPARFLWTGTLWICMKPGQMIGTPMNWDGPSLPSGYLVLDGSAYNSTTFAELFAVLGSATLRDKRGRTEIGSGTGSGLTNRVSGTAYGGEAVALATTHLPSLVPTGNVNLSGGGSGQNLGVFSGAAVTGGGIPILTNLGGNTSLPVFNNPTYTFAGNQIGGSSTPFSIMNPTIGTQKLIRAC